jgi:hypothetical protein
MPINTDTDRPLRLFQKRQEYFTNPCYNLYKLFIRSLLGNVYLNFYIKELK